MTTKLDADLTLREAFDDNSNAFKVLTQGSLVPQSYDYIALTYYTSGNGNGQIQTVTYKVGGSGGTTVATLTLTYDSNANIADITKS